MNEIMNTKYPASIAAASARPAAIPAHQASFPGAIRRLLPVCALMFASGLTAQAATLTWDGGPSTAGTSGNGTEWGTAANWRGDTAFSDGDSVLFTTVGNTTAAGTASGVTTSGSTTMTLPGYILGGAEVGQAISGTNIPAGTYIAAIINSNTIELSQAATNSGSGTHVIANTGLSSGTTITLGADRAVDTLTFNNRTNSYALTLGSAADISAGHTLTLGNVNLPQSFTSNLTIASNVILAGGSGGRSSWRDVGSGTTTVSGAIGGAGTVALVKTGTAGTLNLDGANTFSGSLLVEAGTLNLRGSNAYTGATIVSGGTLGLNFNSGTAAVPAGNIINSASVLVLGGVRGGGTVTTTGKAGSSVSQSFNGTTINSGASTLNISNGGTAGTNTLVNLGAISRTTGGTVNFVQPTGTGNTTVGATNGYTTTTANDASGILGGYATVGGTDWATKSGANIVAYTAYTDQTGNVMADAPTANLRITNGTAGNITQNSGTTTVNTLRVNDATARTLTVGSGNTLRLGATGGILSTGANGITIGASGNAGTLTAGGADNTAGEVIFHNSTAVTVNSVVADNGSGVVGLTKSGSGATTLNAANTYTGATTVNAGTLTLAAAVNPLSTAGAITVNGGTLSFGGAQTTTGAVTLAGGTISGGTLTNNGSALDARNGAINTTLAGSAGITKTTGGTLTLGNTAANTFSGDTVVTEGVLTASSTNVVSIGGNLTIGSSGGGNAATFNSGSASSWAQGKTLTVYSNGTVNFGNNAQVLAAASTLNITGGTVIGTSIVNNAAATINLTGGTLNGNFTGAAATYNILSSATTSSVGIATSAGNQTFNVDDGVAATDLSYTGTLGGAFGIVKNGAGLMAATSNSAYTGATTINAGTLSVVTLANGGTISNLGASTNVASNLLLRDGATLRYTGSGHGTDRLFTVGSNGAGHSATLDASGTGAVSFTNTGSVAWGTTNQTRTLKLGGTGTANNTLSALVADNGTGAVSLTKQGAGTWVLANANTYTGATAVEGGRLALASGGSIASASALSIGSAATFDVSAKSAYALGTGGVTIGVGSGSAGLFEAGAAALTFGGTLTLDFAGPSFASSYNLFDFGSQSGDFTSVVATGGISGTFTSSGADTWTGVFGDFTLSFSETTGILSVSAVPEPSTFAAISGVMALAVAGWHSRKRRA